MAEGAHQAGRQKVLIGDNGSGK